ncbi:hypothetical protein SDC9_205619 [bioreactor metagenome]|uniref:Uncharacterized protein n=1 Tax=bioreactor metagenome TaxID=1076179 RepID=A0A645JED1_9ZZZZ
MVFDLVIHVLAAELHHVRFTGAAHAGIWHRESVFSGETGVDELFALYGNTGADQVGDHAFGLDRHGDLGQFGLSIEWARHCKSPWVERVKRG